MPSGAYQAISIYLLERDLLMWIPRYKYLRASGVSVCVRACKLGFICSDNSEGMGACDWLHAPFLIQIAEAVTGHIASHLPIHFLVVLLHEAVEAV